MNILHLEYFNNLWRFQMAHYMYYYIVGIYADCVRILFFLLLFSILRISFMGNKQIEIGFLTTSETIFHYGLDLWWNEMCVFFLSSRFHIEVKRCGIECFMMPFSIWLPNKKRKTVIKTKNRTFDRIIIYYNFIFIQYSYENHWIFQKPFIV